MPSQHLQTLNNEDTLQRRKYQALDVSCKVTGLDSTVIGRASYSGVVDPRSIQGRVITKTLQEGAVPSSLGIWH